MLLGEGELVDLMKLAANTKDYTNVDKCICEEVVQQLYNNGQGRLIPINHLILLRNRERPKSKLLEENKRLMDENGEFPKLELPTEDPSIDINNYDKSKYRFCCYNLDFMGPVSEGILLLSLLNSTSIHRELARRLLKYFPRLINDVYLSEEYYGESCLHIAIVNEDPEMVKILLDYGIDVDQRCFGNFMSPEDQKSYRYDVLDDEIVHTCVNTNYEGYIYWGEYPLSFAACLNQEDCYRLILSRGANVDNQDTNGNSTAHMMVIYNNIEMFNMVYECGANIDLVSRQGLTPLNLAAKLAKKEIFAHILEVKREIYWQIGNITCAAYPLTNLDTINPLTGHIDNKSSLNLIVHGEKLEHLDMLVGVVVDLLYSKWNAFIKTKFQRMMTAFTVYFILNIICILLRPTDCFKVFNFSNNTPELISKDFGNQLEMRNIYNCFKSNNICNFETNNSSKLLLAHFDLETSGNGDFNHFYSNSFDSFLHNKEKSNSNLLDNQTGFTRSKFVVNLYPNISSTSNKSSSYLNKFQFASYTASSIISAQSTSDEHLLNIINRTKNDKKIESTQKMSTLVNQKSTFSTNMGALFLSRHDLNMTVENMNDSFIKGDNSNIVIYCGCRMLQYNKTTDVIRWFIEAVVLGWTFYYLFEAFSETQFLGYHMFIESLTNVPSRVLFLIGCCVKIFVLPARFLCADQVEHVLVIISVLITAPYYLFFCRGYKTVGPFVTMIYKMIVGDLLRFVIIYMVFVMGFSQAYYLIYRSFRPPNNEENPMGTPMQSIILMFLASLSNFGDLYNNLKYTNQQLVGQILFIIYMVIVAILLINMLIAMMGNTYQKIAELKNEWMRQWARIVLVVERSVRPEKRLDFLKLYSKQMPDGTPALVLRKLQSDEEMSVMRNILELKVRHTRNMRKRSYGAC